MSTYKKHTWGSGIPNRKKFDEMDSEIQRLAEGGGGLPPTGNLHEILKVGSTGPMWGKADSDFVNYVDTPTHENGSVGAKLSELSEKIVKLSHDYSTTEFNTGRKWIDGSTIYEKVFTGTITATGADINIGILTDYDKIISICGAVQCTDKCAYFLNDYGDVNSSGRLNIEIDVNGNVMIFSRKSIIVGADVIAIIHYTKSTNGGN